MPSNQFGQMNVTINDTRIPFQYPPTLFMHNIVLGIFSGKEYPLVNLPHFNPSIIVDVGANVGATALFFHASYPNAQIFCYEPSESNYNYLAANTKEFENITSYPYGLYNTACEKSLYIGRDQPAQNSIIASNGTSEVTETIRLAQSSTELIRAELERISILKIDTEGCELQILEDILEKAPHIAIDVIYIEYHSEEDRRAIDTLLTPAFVLAYAKTADFHLGNIIYVSQNYLTENNIDINSKRIASS